MINLLFRGQDVFLLNTCLGDEEMQNQIKELLWIDSSTASDDSGQCFCHFFDFNLNIQ